MTPLAIGSSESPSDRNASFKIEFKITFELIGSSFKFWASKNLRNIRAQILDAFIDGSQNAVWHSET